MKKFIVLFALMTVIVLFLLSIHPVSGIITNKYTIPERMEIVPAYSPANVLNLDYPRFVPARFLIEIGKQTMEVDSVTYNQYKIGDTVKIN